MKIKDVILKSLLPVIITLACASRAEAGTKTWVGGAAGHLNDWNTSANWNPAGIPASGDDATIPSTTYSPILNVAASNSIHNLTVNSGATFTVASGGSLSGSGAPTINGTLNLTGGSLLMTSGNLGLSGALNLSGGTFSVNDFNGTGTANISGGTVVVNHDFNPTGTATQSGGLIQVAHDFHAATNEFSATGGTVEFTSSSGPGAFPTGTYQFYNVFIDAAVDPGFDNKASTIIITGNWTNNGATTLTGKNTTVVFSGTTGQTIGGSSSTTFQNLTINDNSGVTLTSPVTVNGTLTLSNGVLTTGNKLSFGAGSVIAGGGAGSYISGNIQKTVGVGNNQTITFPVGSASGYAPVTLSSLNVTAAGTLTISATAGEHPAIGSSGINSSKDANLYWTITPGSGLVVSSYSATFNFVSGQLDAGANPLAFVVKRYSGSWSVPTTGPATATATTATGLTAFGDFAVGETGPSGPCSLTTCSKTSGNCMAVAFSGVANHTYTLQASVDLKTWVNIGTSTAGTNGLSQFTDTNSASYSMRFYRTVY